MKTRLSIRPLSRPRRRGLTILEMLVSTAMLLFIVLGLTAMLIQTQKAFKSGIKQNTITDAGRAIMGLIAGDLVRMSDSLDTNIPPVNYNFYWNISSNSTLVSYDDTVAVRTNELNGFFILEHTNTSWIGVGYAVSNYPGVAIGALYRYQTNWNNLAPAFSNDLFTPFFTNIFITNFPTNFWHQIADGVIDLKVRAYDQFGNANYFNQWGYYSNVSYPIGGYPLGGTNVWTNRLPNSVDLELGILEPDALIQARGLVIPGNPAPLANFLASNSAPKMEIFRQRVTIPAASR